jgi:hypothetical protein
MLTPIAKSNSVLPCTGHQGALCYLCGTLTLKVYAQSQAAGLLQNLRSHRHCYRRYYQHLRLTKWVAD